MPSIHVITDSERLKRLFSTFATQDLSVRISGGLDAGLPELQHEAPEALFIQNHLNGLTAEILVRHVQNYAPPATKLVLLREGVESCRGVSLGLNTAAEDDELLEAIREAIDRLAFGIKPPPPPRRKAATVTDEHPEETEAEPSDETRNMVAEPPLASTTPEFAASLDGFMREMKGEAAPSLKPSPAERPKFKDAPALGKTAGIAIAAILAIAAAIALMPHGKKTATVTHLESPTPKPAVPAPATAAKPAATQEKKAPPAVVVPVPPAKVAPAPEPEKQVAAASKPPTPATSPAQKQPAPAPAKPTTSPAPQQQIAATKPAPAQSAVKPPAAAPQSAARTELPGFIPKSGIDKKYPASKPGWERYLGKNTEFRVFRPSGVVKAVQAIDRKGVGIPDDFLQFALKDMVGSPAFTVEGKEKKGDFLVTRATAAGGLRIVLYRKGENKPLKAFVVYFDEPRKK